MRRLLGLLLLTTLLLGLATACGDDDDATAEDPAATAPATSSTPTGTPTPSNATTPTPTAPDTSQGTPQGSPVDFTEIALVSQTAAGTGSTDQTGVAAVLDGQQAIGPFVDQFQQGALTGDLLAAIDEAQVPDGQVLVGAVVAVGCDVPPGIASVTKDGSKLVITPQKVADPLQECFAAVTTVALVAVPASAV